MILNIKPGLENEMTREVSEQDIATSFGNEHMPVLATSRIVAFMEYVALSSVQGLLPDGYSTVGSEISIKHLRPVTLGQRVTCSSRLVKTEGRKLFFELTMRNAFELVSTATHIRTVINERVFERLVGLEEESEEI